MRHVVAAAVLLVACVQSNAAPVRYEFSGIIDSGNSNFLSFPSNFPIALGDTFSGSIFYDTQDRRAIGPISQTYFNVVAFELRVGSSLVYSQTIQNIGGTTSYGGTENTLRIYSPTPDQPPTDGFLDDLYMNFRVPTLDPSGQLPDDPQLETLGTGEVRLFFFGLEFPGCSPCTAYTGIYGTITNVARVPEPAALGIFVLGLLGAAAARATRTRRR